MTNVWSTFGRRLVALPGVSAFTTFIGLGTAAFKNTGTSGDTVPLLNTGATWDLGSGALALEKTAAFSTLNMTRRGTPAASVFAAAINFSAPNSTPISVAYGQFTVFITTNTAGSEDGDFRFTTTRAGVLANRLILGDGAYHPSATGGDKGNNTLNFGHLWYNGVQLSPPGNVVTKTADFTVAASEQYLINNKAGSTCTVTLPTASSFPGRKLHFKNSQAQTVVSASSNVVPRVTAAASTAILASGSGNWCKMVSDGTNWVIMAGS
jgi:hypothetical protein